MKNVRHSWKDWDDAGQIRLANRPACTSVLLRMSRADDGGKLADWWPPGHPQDAFDAIIAVLAHPYPEPGAKGGKGNRRSSVESPDPASVRGAGCTADVLQVRNGANAHHGSGYPESVGTGDRRAYANANAHADARASNAEADSQSNTVAHATTSAVGRSEGWVTEADD